MFGRDIVEGLVVGFLIADERAVGFDDDVVLLAVFDSLALLTPWVELSTLAELYFTRDFRAVL